VQPTISVGAKNGFDSNISNVEAPAAAVGALGAGITATTT
jgi:hypothetical protein